MEYDFDFIVIGSGFGGSVSALRLTEKGYKVAVVEMGKRYRQYDFPKTNWNFRKYLWFPSFGLHGFFRMSLFKHAWVLTGVGVGGGSLVYSNTLWVPHEKVWKDTQWQHLENWAETMPPFYELSMKMLGGAKNTYLGTADKALQTVANEEGIGDTFYTTNVSIYFGEPEVTGPDPYFGGEGPERTGCNFCGGCMVGCRVGAKNSLDYNYLYLAEKKGAKIFAETMVVDVHPLNNKIDGTDGYEIYTKKSTGILPRRKMFRARGVVFSAGVLGTVKLLLKLKENQSLPNLSNRIGDFIRTNSESIIGVRTQDKKLDVSDGVCIGSGIFLDETTHIEAVRFPKKSDSIAPLTTILSETNPAIPRPITWFKDIVKSPVKFIKTLIPFGFGRSTMILLVMQTIERYLKMDLKRSFWPPFKKKLVTRGGKIPTFIPKANKFAFKIAEKINGTPVTSLTEIFLDIPTTAHILGGAAMGTTSKEGVIDSKNRVFNYKNLYVCDGSMIGANLGVNPSLTITAISERAMSFIDPIGETDWDEIGQPLYPDNHSSKPYTFPPNQERATPPKP